MYDLGQLNLHPKNQSLTWLTQNLGALTNLQFETTVIFAYEIEYEPTERRQPVQKNRTGLY